LSYWIRIQEGKNDPQYRKELRNAECSLLRAEGFSCSLGVLYRGLEINFSAVTFYSIFVHQNPGSGSGSAVRKMLDPNPYLINPYQKP
jgi:hypothetical protein